MTAPTYDKLTTPSTGTRAVNQNGAWMFPDDPIVKTEPTCSLMLLLLGRVR